MPSKLRSSIYVMRENFHLSCGGSYKAKEGNFLSSRGRRGVGVPPPPWENFWKTDATGAFWAHFLPTCRFFSQNFVCNSCLQSSDLQYVMRKNFHLSCRGSISQRGELFYHCRRGGRSPRGNFWKTDANGAFLAHFCRLPVDFFPKNLV